jgi:hypothetical protein
LIHLGHPSIHGDEADAKFVFHSRAQEHAVNLDRPGLPHRHAAPAG